MKKNYDGEMVKEGEPKILEIVSLSKQTKKEPKCLTKTDPQKGQ